MTTAQTSPAQNRGQAWRARELRRGAYGAAQDVPPGCSGNSPAPGRSSGIATRPKVAPDPLAEGMAV